MTWPMLIVFAIAIAGIILFLWDAWRNDPKYGGRKRG
jgi:hypothetical protein